MQAAAQFAETLGAPAWQQSAPYGSHFLSEHACYMGSLSRDQRQVRDLLHMIDRVAETQSTVLIRGESGVGKELVSRAVHRKSQRARQPFVVVDCAALHENLLQSELFGHEKGAYTGAVRLKHGLLALKNGQFAIVRIRLLFIQLPLPRIVDQRACQ